MRVVLGRIILLIVVLGVLLIGALWTALPVERIGQIASTRLEAATGRTLTLSEGFRPTLWPRLGVTTGPLAVSNADWAATPQMVQAQAATIAIAPLALLGGRLEIETVALDTPRIWLEIAADGRRNWDLAGDAARTAEAGIGEGQARGAAQLTRLAAEITDAEIRFRDDSTGTAHSALGLDMTLDYDADARRAELTGAGRVDGIALELEATLRSERPLDRLRDLDVMLEVRSDLAELEIAGRLEHLAARTGDLEVTARIGDVASLLDALGQAPLPQGTGSLRDVDLRAALGQSDTATVSEITATLNRNGTAIALTVRADGGADWLSGTPVAADISLDAGDFAQARFGGALSVAGTARGQMSLSVSDMREALVALDMPTGALPPIADGPMRLDGLLDVRPTGSGGPALGLSDASLALRAMVLDGDLRFIPGARPVITGDLRADVIRLTDLTGPAAASTTPARTVPAGAWDTTPLPWDMLERADLDLRFATELIELGTTDLRAVALGLRLASGQGMLTLDRVGTFGGTLRGDIALNGPARSLRTDLRLDAVRIEQVLRAAADLDRIEGQGDFAVAVQARGASVADLMATLDGTIRADLSDGAVRGVNLAEIARNLTGAVARSARTDFTEAAVTFAARDGALTTQDITALGPLLRLTGSGTVSLPTRSLDLTLRPRVTTDLVGQGGDLDVAGIVIPVRVRGPWSNLSYRPDLGAYEDALRAEADEAVDQARTRLIEDLTDGRDPDDALQGALGTLEDALGAGEGGALDALRGLFD